MRKANNHYGTCCFRYAPTAPRYTLQVLVAKKLLRALRCYRWCEKELKSEESFHFPLYTLRATQKMPIIDLYREKELKSE
ncbi:hypothetical protein RM545_11900 [Zunongwangia sp. F260]|uniref:Uncharacterized protein n=1 Tax=Autumnicola lenta TaxID=3075593 RepID=A0ABU3CN89_9FLAO|nr:hypothetical protein [Zunongwangia sp. F260]MDT0647395.1 hypothetical protein [Zunongwangia sp. F260]